MTPVRRRLHRRGQLPDQGRRLAHDPLESRAPVGHLGHLVSLPRQDRPLPAGFRRSDDWTIQIVAPRHLTLVTRFATTRADKFTGGEFTPDDRQLLCFRRAFQPVAGF